ncbi:MAG: FAD-binding protein, partial [Chloroflexi bacterium]|nr:FAD-binding protein [Chloroflexota bacterium]
MTIRDVIKATTPPIHASAQRALELLEGPASALEALAAELASGLGGGAADVEIDRPNRLLFATDASIYEMEPIAVVYPRSREEIQHVIRVAGERGVPVLSRGAGTSLAGQTVNHAIVLDCSRHMSSLVELNAEEQWARVQPGIVVDELNRLLKPHGLQYPIDTSTKNRATVGGGLGNNSCGAHSCVYGKTIDQVIALDVVLSDATATTFEDVSGAQLATKLDLPGIEGGIYRGTREIAAAHRAEIDARFPNIQRRVSGYNLDAALDEDRINLSEVVVGSEGTLAVITEAKVKVVPLPTLKGLAAVHCRDIVDAANATVAALGHPVSAIELVGEAIIERCRESIGYSKLLDRVIGEPGAILMVEFYGESEAELQAKLEALVADMLATGLAYAAPTTTDNGEQARWWRIREAGLGLLMSVKGDAKPVAIVEDTAVPPEKLAEYLTRFDAIVRSHGTTAAYYGHASVGCLHIRPLVNVKTEEGLDTTEAIATEIAELVLEFGGSLSGEHGDGILRGVFTEKMFGPEITEAFRELKRTWDPQGLLNPGKIIDTPGFRENLRLGPQTVNLEVRTHLDFSAEGGLARAVELCNGQGACRKLDGGMCPSYMVTLDEEHSTRGRANLLRQALNGVLPAEELAGERIQEALDLCVECKACKSECPSGVDMAKLKYEVLTKHHEAHGLPLRSRMFGRIATMSALGSRVGPLVPIVNLVNRNPLVRLAMQRFGGIHRKRPLPALARRPFRRWFRGRSAARVAPRGDVVFFDDTFTQYYHPEVGQAATVVLEALGYRVTLVERLGCCGRPLISKGQLGMAREWAAANIARLAPFAAAGTPIVGIEPSCLLTLRDEYPELVATDDARQVAASAFLLDELIAKLAEEEPDAIAAVFAGVGGGEILVHGHCHQKALVGMEATEGALRLAGYTASTIDSACCGMAGSFGFEDEHYGISEAMARRSLVPAVDAAAADTGIAITGVSCRQQIGHFSTREPKHVVEYLAAALATGAPGAA